MRTLIVLGGDLPSTELLAGLASGADLKIAADRGLEAFDASGIVPDLLLGDMDSVRPEVLRVYETMVPERRLPSMKDDTDGQDALMTAIRQGADDILILGALGGRLDHALGNLALLLFAVHRGVRARLTDGRVTIEAVSRGKLYIEGKKGDTVSVMPMGTVSGVTLEGFVYPLRDAEMKAENTLGISNVLEEDRGIIRIRDGDAVVFHYHEEKIPEWSRGITGEDQDECSGYAGETGDGDAFSSGTEKCGNAGQGSCDISG